MLFVVESEICRKKSSGMRYLAELGQFGTFLTEIKENEPKCNNNKVTILTKILATIRNEGSIWREVVQERGIEMPNKSVDCDAIQEWNWNAMVDKFYYWSPTSIPYIQYNCPTWLTLNMLLENDDQND